MSRNPPVSMRMSKRNCCPARNPPQHLVMLAAMPQAQVDNLAPPPLARHLHRLPNLPVRMMAMLVEQSRRDLHFQRLFVEQIHNRLRRRQRLVGHQLARGLAQLAPRCHLILIRIGILHQRRRHPHFAQQLLLSPCPQLRIHRPNLLHQFAQRLGIDVVCRPSCRLLQRLAQHCAPRRCVCESRCATCVSSVRALTISPSEVFVASGSR